MEELIAPMCSEARIKLIMDDREPSDVMLPAFRHCGCFDVDVLRLTTADYVVNDVLLVERKTLSDLVQSIIDGRLFHQAKRLVEAEHAAALVLEGSFRNLQTEMRWEAIQGALVTVSLFFGLPVLRTRNPDDTARVLAYAARQQLAVETDTLVRHGRRPKRKAALQSFILQGLPGVGSKRARQLLAHFGSVEGVMSATTDALVEVEGLGLQTAERIRAALT